MLPADCDWSRRAAERARGRVTWFGESEFERQRELRESVARDRSFYWGHLSLARLDRAGNRTATALESLGDALSARPGFAEARLELAELLVELGRYEEARV